MSSAPFLAGRGRLLERLLVGLVVLSAPALLATPSIDAVRVVADAPVIDGRLEEPVWQRADVASDFIQRRPLEGQPATEKTEVRVLVDDDALYVGFRAFDSDPAAIEAQLTRRDQWSFSDWVHVAIDSLNDRRTAFRFGVNPMGVKRDYYLYDDDDSDRDWDAVWDVATSIDELGWVAEFRIPLSQLRFQKGAEPDWGIQFIRGIARKSESLYWAPVPGDANAMVSLFGRLRGLSELQERRQFEVSPYAVAQLTRETGDTANPFYRPSRAERKMGLGLKYGLSPNLTLDVAINPDFGQVEADPGQVNLTDSEIFFDEKRPFFLEGSNIFAFDTADGGRDTLFYSRRIGRTPQGSVDARGGYFEAENFTTIQTAVKVSGKTASGWTVGALAASTERELAQVVGADGSASADPIEPASRYGFARLQKDFRDGQSAVGVIATTTSRDATAQALDLHDKATTGGIDVRHRFLDNFELEGMWVGSKVSGRPAAIARTQRASSRYMQRPDATHLTYDPTRTALSGSNFMMRLGRVSGGFWRYGAGYHARTPTFETNDIGFMQRADSKRTWAWFSFNHYLPTDALRRWDVKVRTWRTMNYGGERTSLGLNVNGNLQLHNYWGLWGGISLHDGSISTGSLRGGPALQTEEQVNVWSGFGTDGRKPLRLNLNVNLNARPESESYGFNISPRLSWRPSGRMQMSLGAFYNENVNDRQWVGAVTTDDPHYLVSRISQRTVGVTGRMEYAVTPELSLQVYVHPFVAAGEYDDFKEVVDPRAGTYADRFAALDTVWEDGSYLADLDGDGTAESFRDPDFNAKQFRSNTVLRWEYRPGSTLYAVWSQGRDHYSRSAFDAAEDFSSLFGAPSDDVFVVKVRHWFTPSSS